MPISTVWCKCQRLGYSTIPGRFAAQVTPVFVERPIYDEVVERVAAFGAAMRVGSPLDPETQIGPLVSGKQYERVASYLELGPQEGARIATGGARLTGGIYDADIMSHRRSLPTCAMTCGSRRRRFSGPVVCAMPFDDFDDVIRRANATQYGLAGAVWTQDITKAHRAMKRIRAGTIWINHYQAMDPAVPFGGYKMSGFGREGSVEHLDAYLQTKGVWVRTD